jgi:hypothetical protein
MYQGMIGFVLFFVAALATADEIYRWQDESGADHFSNQQSAPVNAQLFKAGVPISVVEMVEVKASKSFPVELSPTKRRHSRSSRTRPSPVESESGSLYSESQGQLKGHKKRPVKKQRQLQEHTMVPVSDIEHHRIFCDNWRERLRRSRLGLRDHEGQSAYERECILKVHW